MSPAAGLLLSTAADRLRRARPDLVAGREPTSVEELLALRRELADAEDGADGGVAAVCVVRDVRPAAWVAGACAFAASLSPRAGREWRTAFTRTLFLAGRPDNLAGRFAFDRVADDGSAAWLAPAPVGRSLTLRRLLKTFAGDAPCAVRPPVTVVVPGGTGRAPVHRELHVACAGVTVARALVQVHHLLAEAVLDGLVSAGDRLTVRRVPELTDPAAGTAALRVDAADDGTPRLRAYAALTKEM